MAEFKYSLKILALTVVIVLAMQVRVSNLTVESYAETWIRTSTLPKYLQKVADGATLAVHNATKTMGNVFSQGLGGDPENRASRLGVGFHRSAAAVEVNESHSKTKTPSAVDGEE